MNNNFYKKSIQFDVKSVDNETRQNPRKKKRKVKKVKKRTSSRPISDYSDQSLSPRSGPNSASFLNNISSSKPQSPPYNQASQNTIQGHQGESQTHEDEDESEIISNSKS